MKAVRSYNPITGILPLFVRNHKKKFFFKGTKCSAILSILYFRMFIQLVPKVQNRCIDINKKIRDKNQGRFTAKNSPTLYIPNNI